MYPYVSFKSLFFLRQNVHSIHLRTHTHTHKTTDHVNRDSPVRLAKSIRVMIRASANEMESVGRIMCAVAILDTRVMHVIS